MQPGRGGGENVSPDGSPVSVNVQEVFPKLAKKSMFMTKGISNE